MEHKIAPHSGVMQNKMATLKEIIKYSKANPTSDYAKTAQQHITNGDFDAQAQKEGIDLSWAGRPKPASQTKIQQEGASANKFLGKSTAGQLVSKETLKEIPGQALKTAKELFIDTPVKVAKSLADIPVSIVNAIQGKVGKEIPGTYQAEAQQTASDVIEGKKPLISALKPFAQVPLDVATTALEAKGLYSAGKKIIEKTPAIAKKATNLVKDTSGKISSAISKKLEEKGANKATNLIKSTEDTMTKTERLSALGEKGRVKVTKLGKTEFLPTKTETKAGELLSGKLKSNPVKNIPIIKNEIATRGAEAENFLVKNAKPITAQEQSDVFKTVRDKMAKYSTKEELKAYDEQMKMFLKQIPGRGGYNTGNFYKALKEYETNVASKLAKGKEALLDPTGIASAKLNAAKDIRKVVRDLIGNKHPEFKGKMFDLTSLYDALDNVVVKGEKTAGNIISRSFKKHPYISSAVTGALGVEGIRKIIGQ